MAKSRGFLGRWEQLLSRKMRPTSPNLPKRILQNRRPWKPTDQTPWQRSRQLWLSHIICKSRPATWAYDQPPSSKHHPRRSDSMACRPEAESHVCHGQTWTSALWCRIFSERRAIAAYDFSRVPTFLPCTRRRGRTNGQSSRPSALHLP